jgi:uncharacterized protein GlcG (DUF336 family)
VHVQAGVGHVQDQLADGLQHGPVVLEGTGHDTLVKALAACRAVGRTVGLQVLDRDGVTRGVERTQQARAVVKVGTTVSTRPSVRSTRKFSKVNAWTLDVVPLPAGWSTAATLDGVPDSRTVNLDASDVVVELDGGGLGYVMGPALRWVAD